MIPSVECGWARLDVEPHGPVGTAYFVGPRWAVTCHHLVKGVRDSDQLRLTLADGRRVRAVVVEVAAGADWALLKLARPAAGVRILRLATACRRGDPWEAWGPPATTGTPRTWFAGEVQSADAGRPRGPQVIRLFSSRFAGVRGAPLPLLAGAPVFVGDAVVGHVRQARRRTPADGAPGYAVVCPCGEYLASLSKQSRLAAGFRPLSPRVGAGVPRGAPPTGPGGEAGTPGMGDVPGAPPPLQPPLGLYDPAWYIVRGNIEKRAADLLAQPGRPLVLWGGERSGKTWLLHHLLLPLQSDPSDRVVRVNLDLLDPEAWTSLSNLLYYLAYDIGEALAIEDGALDAAWKVPGAKNRMQRFMERHALPAVNGRLILAIDQADTILRRSQDNSGAEFFALLRGWAAAPAEPWTRLRLVLAVSASPESLAKDLDPSTFNSLSDPIRLAPLSDEQVRKLAKLHGLTWTEPEIGRLKELVGGHPYLLRRAMYEAAESKTPLDQLLDPKDPRGRLFDDFLEGYRTHLGGAVDVLRKMRAKEPLAPQDQAPARTLERVGIAERDAAGSYRIVCRLFERLLDA